MTGKIQNTCSTCIKTAQSWQDHTEDDGFDGGVQTCDQQIEFRHGNQEPQRSHHTDEPKHPRVVFSCRMVSDAVGGMRISTSHWATGPLVIS